MSTASPDIIAMAHQKISAELSSRIRDELNKAALPVARSLNLSMAYLTDAGEEWLTDSFCSYAINDQPDRCWAGHARAKVEIVCEGGVAGAVLLCGDALQEVRAAMVSIIETITRQIEMENNETALLEELSASWESLEAVYEISSDLRAFASPTDLLDRIMTRATSFQEHLRATLWLERDNELEPVAAKNIEGLATRSKSEGLIGRALAEKNGIILNGRNRVTASLDIEPEFRNAFSLLIAPVETRQGLVNALAIWNEEGDRQFDSRTMRLAEALALQAAMVIENDRLHRASIESERLKQEAEIGGKIQQTLLLGQPPRDIERLQVAALTVPSQRIDGDFYDFVRHNDQCMDVLVGDVMGKGIPAALLGAATKNCFMRATSALMASAEIAQIPRPEDIVSLVHDEVTRQFMAFDSFATLCYARFDLACNQMDFVDCGHTKTIHYRKRFDRCDLLEGENMPIGFVESESHSQASVSFDEGDVFFFYSDGVTEAQNQAGEMFEQDRLCKLVRANSHLHSEEIVASVKRAIAEFSGSETFADDLTCVAVRIASSKSKDAPSKDAPLKKETMEISSDLNNLARARQFLRRICAQSNPSMEEGRIIEFELAVTEALSNICRHAYHSREDERIEMRAAVASDSIIIELLHSGDTFDPSRVEMPAFDGSREGGFGIFIIQQATDEIVYSEVESGRRLIRLTKKIKGDHQDGSND